MKFTKKQSDRMEINLMLLSNLLNNVAVKNEYEDCDIKDIKCNSNDNLNNCLFFCIKGNKQDGHSFFHNALKKGAVYVVTEKDLEIDNQIIVSDTREAYAIACANYFGNPAKDMKLCAVTGTNGKTSVATITKRILELSGQKVGLISTIAAEYNGKTIPVSNTTPDAYEFHRILNLMRNDGINIVCLEASSHGLDQKRLFGVRFSVAIFTNLTQDHLDYHKNMVEYYNAKKKLFYVSDCAVINIDDEYGKRLASEVTIPVKKCSIKDIKADYVAEEIILKCNEVSYYIRNNDIKCKMIYCSSGEYSVENSMLAAVACFELGLSVSAVAEGLYFVGNVKGRNEVIAKTKDFSVVCDYAHTPDALENLLISTKKYVTGRIILVFGCGGDRDKTKRSIMGKIATEYADLTVITTDNPRTEPPKAIMGDIIKGIKSGSRFIAIQDRPTAIKYAISNAKKGDIVLLVGKGHEEYQVLGNKKIYFDERRLVHGIIRNMGIK